MIVAKRVLCLSLLAAILVTLLGLPGLLGAQEDKVDLSLRLLPEYYYREVIPGQDNTLFMEVRNNGNKEITNIKFGSDKPEGWLVEFRPGNINYLGAGSSQGVDVNVIPRHDTGRGEYSLALLAEANETRTATSTMLRVESGSGLWLWVGVGLAALVIAGFVIIFLRFGRQ
ncbi:NEW3 domain-containing protein [Chloroflexota bacterium]